MTEALKEKVAIFTGGSGGIGSAICERLSSEGAAVVVPYSGHEAAAQQVVQKITANNGKAIAIQADSSQSKQVAALFDRTEQQFGTLDIVVNVARVCLVGAIAVVGLLVILFKPVAATCKARRKPEETTTT
jgi:3-oxoacyl-[acyl-carrier protein] reductase